MKKNIFILLLTVFCFSAQAQGKYTLSVGNTTYSELPAEAKKLSTEANQFYLDLPFEAKIGKETVKKLDFFSDSEYWGLAGVAEEGQQERQYVIPYNSSGSIYYSELKDYPNAGIYYITEGEEGDRIFKMEWRNIPTLAQTKTNFNFQAWLHEKDNSITLLMGEIENPVDSIVNSNTYIGILHNVTESNIGEESFLLTGDPQNPTIESGISYQSPPSALNTAPKKGTMYKIKYQTTSSTTKTKQYSGEVQVFPNPAKETVRVALKEPSTYIRDVKIVDIKGAYHTQVNTQFENIDISGLKSGYYILEINTNKGISYQKLSVLK